MSDWPFTLYWEGGGGACSALWCLIYIGYSPDSLVHSARHKQHSLLTIAPCRSCLALRLCYNPSHHTPAGMRFIYIDSYNTPPVQMYRLMLTWLWCWHFLPNGSRNISAIQSVTEDVCMRVTFASWDEQRERPRRAMTRIPINVQHSIGQSKSVRWK